VTTIGLQPTRCGYAEIIDKFEERTGVQVNDLDPEATSAQQLEAIAAGRDNAGLAAPDVIDVDLPSGAEAKGRDLIQPYKVATWDTILASARDADGAWSGGYYGVVAFEVNTDVVASVPQDWLDLLDNGYAAQVAVAGDPRVSSEAMYAVYAAALASGGTLDQATKGLEFFMDLNAVGNFMPVIGKTSTVAQGETPIRLAWTYNARDDRDALEGTAKIEVVVPQSGRLAGIAVQAISRYATHPNAAKLWMEFLHSDEGQSLLLKGYCHPIRYANLLANDRIPLAQLDALPDVAGVVFQTLDQVNAAGGLSTSKWDEVVGAEIVCSLDCE